MKSDASPAAYYQALPTISQSLGKVLSPDELYHTVYIETQRVLKAEGFYITIYDHERDLANVVFYADEGRERRIDITFRGSDSEVLRTGRGSIIRHRSEATSLLVLGESPKMTQSSISAPMIRKDKVIGAISAQRYEQGAYTEDDLELLGAVADIVATGVLNVQYVSDLDQERQKADELLLQLLPSPIVGELKEKGKVEPKYFPDISVLFADLVGFTQLCEDLTIEDTVSLLRDIFSEFDDILLAFNLDKLKTIGDSYMAAGGLFRKGAEHAVDIVLAAQQMIEFVRGYSTRAILSNDLSLRLRVGIHTGPAIGGIVGELRPSFDIWGDTVNRAARVEQHGREDSIVVSENTFVRIKDFVEMEARDSVITKEGSPLRTFRVVDIRAELKNDPDLFVRRYRRFFGKRPPDFPFIER